ncbi:MAG: hypothetical protein GY851_00510 [bacterium]|nr:hypothetical protein [bacterium]
MKDSHLMGPDEDDDTDTDSEDTDTGGEDTTDSDAGSGWGDYSGTGESSESAITDSWGKDTTH